MKIAASIVVATFKRASSLLQLMESLRKARRASECEVIIAENGTTEAIEELQKKDWRPLSIVPIAVTSIGKSLALNEAIKFVRGRLTLFTDDDVTVCPTWASSYLEAHEDFPAARILGGPIQPIFSGLIPEWLQQHPLSDIMFADFRPSVARGPMPFRPSPLGPNFALRSDLLDKVQFRTDLGPSEVNGSLMCEDTELLEDRLRAVLVAYDSSAQTVFVPDALVYHHIADRKASGSVLADRFFDLGRSHVVRFGRVTHMSPPSSLRTHIIASPADVVTKLAHLNFYCGQLHQLRLSRRVLEVHLLSELLAAMEYSLYHDLLGPKSLKYFETSGPSTSAPEDIGNSKSEMRLVRRVASSLGFATDSCTQ